MICHRSIEHRFKIGDEVWFNMKNAVPKLVSDLYCYSFNSILVKGIIYAYYVNSYRYGHYAGGSRYYEDVKELQANQTLEYEVCVDVPPSALLIAGAGTTHSFIELYKDTHRSKDEIEKDISLMRHFQIVRGTFSIISNKCSASYDELLNSDNKLEAWEILI